MPRYTIITPTILRQSLVKACESVDRQTCTDWEHLVMVDSEISNDLISRIAHPQRRVLRCERPHNNWGHTCANRAWGMAKGDYIYRLDDDNFLADDKVLDYLQCVTAPWAIFPIERFGKRFFHDPPGKLRTDTGSILVERTFARWPDSNDYDADGTFIEALAARQAPQVVGLDRPPLMVMPEGFETRAKAGSLAGDRISIFTPCHDATYLRDAYDSIKDQDFHEWIIAWNNGGVPIDFHDPRVKSHVLYRAPEKVGPLKAYCCEQATGDILLELDCDDMLASTAIEEVKAAFHDPSVGFVYSNAIHAMADLTPYPRFSETYGWRYRETTFRGHKLDEFVSFPPTPEAVSRVWSGPDHLRAFRRTLYQRVGGYDRTLRVLDDSDLVIRMYLETRFHHLDRPLYLYRVHGQNSWLKHNKEIQDGVWPLYDRHIGKIIKRWCEVSSLPWVDVTCCEDICKRGTSTVGCYHIIDTLAKIPEPLNVMRELYRTLVPGGWLLCSVPSTDGRGAWQDPRHVSFWNENSFLYYTNRQWSQHINTPVKFQSVRLYTTEKDANAVSWVIAHLVSLKDNYRPPGELYI